MIVFGLSREHEMQLAKDDALEAWLNSFGHDHEITEEEAGEPMDQFISSHILDHQCDQFSYENNDPDWLSKFPDSFDVIVGVE